MATNIPIVSYPYIRIQLPTMELSWKGNAPDYFTSLTYQRFTDEANRGTVNITYAPGVKDDINAVERALAASQGNALLQYGQINSRARQQYCLIYDYKTSMKNGVLNYTISLVSKSVVHNWTDAKVEEFTGEHAKKEYVLKYMEDTISQVSVKGQGSYKFKLGPGAGDFEIEQLKAIKIGESPIQAVAKIAKGLRAPVDPDRYYYAIEIDDTTNPGTVILMKVDTKQTAAIYTFNWGTKDADVIDWQIDYQGAVAISRARGGFAGAENTETYSTGISESGKWYSYKTNVADIDKAPTVDALANLEVAKFNAAWFTENADYCYKAKLEVLGQSKMMTIGHSIIQVNPLVYGKAHHSAGKYKVIGVTDSVNSSGFHTTYDLVRLSKEQAAEMIYPPAPGEDDELRVFFNGDFHNINELGDLYEKEGTTH